MKSYKPRLYWQVKTQRWRYRSGTVTTVLRCYTGEEIRSYFAFERRINELNKNEQQLNTSIS